MLRIILIFGLASGLVAIFGLLGTIVASPSGHGSIWLGYLVMLVALSSILLAVKQHRDKALGGVIKFWPAFGMGLAIAVVASVAYVAVWEVYSALTDHQYMDAYIVETLQTKSAAGVAGAEYEKLAKEMETMRVRYHNPLFRLPMVFSEIFPVGFLVSLVSAALLRNPKFLPARGAA